ncbi:MAG: hypothetical protein HYW77_01415 [Parcubacteria group bacterium]|nr:hypothetical protein [Parcubacteria group bacterium]
MRTLYVPSEAQKNTYQRLLSKLDFMVMVSDDGSFELHIDGNAWVSEENVNHVLATSFPKLLGFAKIIFDSKQKVLKCPVCGKNLIEPDDEFKRKYSLKPNEYTTTVLVCPWQCVHLNLINREILEPIVDQAHRNLENSVRELEKAAGMKS